MARHIPSGRLSPMPSDRRYAFRHAGAADAVAINGLLADTPLGGTFSVSLERAPDPFSADFGLSKDHVVLLSHDRHSGELVGMCDRVVYPAFVNGKPANLPYLGGLRLKPAFRNRPAIIRGGFDAIRRSGSGSDEVPFALTSITADNDRALRLLTRGIKGLPEYRRAGDYSTFVMRARQRRTDPAIRCATEADYPAIAALLNRENARFQFAPVWSASRLAGLKDHGLRPEHFLLMGEGARLEGCVAVWDQSSRRQTVVRAYPKTLNVLRGLWNVASPIFSLPRLPALGHPLKQVALTHVAVANGNPDLFVNLVNAALSQASNRGFESGFIGLAHDNPLAGLLKRTLRMITYQTILHTVRWPDDPELDLDGSLLVQPEAGLL